MTTELIDQIDAEERYRSGEFIFHLKEEDPCPRHCLRLLCSPFNEPDFRCDCHHPRADRAARHAPLTVDQQHPSRAADSANDWDGHCCVCFADAEDDSNRLVCCTFCRNVAHKKCIATALGNDLPSDLVRDDWACPSCVLEHDVINHDARCLKCEQHDYLLIDLRDMCELALFDSPASVAAKWGLAVLDKEERDLAAYHAHLVRDATQDMFQPWCFEQVARRKDSYCDLYDYWAKQKHGKTKVATCEGMANKGVSVHGRMFTFANPSTETRAAYPQIPWETSYPNTVESGGPSMCREFHRSWSDGSRQTAYDTAATLLAEDIEFRSTHPWLTNHIGASSDGASNYNSTSPALFNLLSPYVNAKLTSVEGMGKDACDRDNANEQQKLRAARASTNLTYTEQYIKACNARRHIGAINARVEIDRTFDMTAEQKKLTNAIYHVDWLKLHDTRGTDLHSWELFSRLLSEEAGRPVGYGRGRITTRAVLREKHGLGYHKLPANGAELSFPHADSLPEGQDARHNAAPALSKQEKKDAVAASKALYDGRAEAKQALATAAEQKVASTHSNKLHTCPDCKLAQFKSEKHLANHRSNNCGQFARRVERRRVHDATTIPALLKLNDGDLAAQTEAQESIGLDVRTFSFESKSLGWELGEQLSGSDLGNVAPIQFAGLSWSAATELTQVPINALVRIPASRFEVTAKDDFNAAWRFSFYYGWCRSIQSQREQTVNIQYVGEDGVLPSHYSHLEVGAASDDVAVLNARPAVVKKRDLGGQAHRQRVPLGGTIVSVAGERAPSFATANRLINDHATAAETPLVIAIRRPEPTQRSRRGSARSAQNARPSHVWQDDVREAFDKILEDPAMERRSDHVETSLHALFPHALTADNKPKVPSLKEIDAYMINAFKKKNTQFRTDAQNAAARALAQAAAAALGGDNDAISSDNDEEDDPDADGATAAPSPISPTPPAPPVPAPNHPSATGVDDDIDDVALLQRVGVSELRRQLREKGAGAIVKQSDLPPDTPASGTSKSAAVHLVLRKRLAPLLRAERHAA